mmetsp:Transcript_17918/g.45823  ORF Transcript_17918/g.45823 Transcript_17918/m.45823 type:complete len:220 (-) Transcript_17918:506-1165(-)
MRQQGGAGAAVRVLRGHLARGDDGDPAERQDDTAEEGGKHPRLKCRKLVEEDGAHRDGAERPEALERGDDPQSLEVCKRLVQICQLCGYRHDEASNESIGSWVAQVTAIPIWAHRGRDELASTLHEEDGPGRHQTDKDRVPNLQHLVLTPAQVAGEWPYCGCGGSFRRCVHLALNVYHHCADTAQQAELDDGKYDECCLAPACQQRVQRLSQLDAFLHL